MGLLLFSKHNGDSRIFTVKELKSKPSIHKQKGMITFPLETFIPEDGDELGTMRRLCEEEIGIRFEEVCFHFINPGRFQLIPGCSDIETAYGFGIYRGNLHRNFSPKDSDIEFAGWKTVEELERAFVRVEVKPILAHFQSNHFQELQNLLS